FDGDAKLDLGVIAGNPLGGVESALLMGTGGGDLTGTPVQVPDLDAKTLSDVIGSGAQWQPVHGATGDTIVGVTGGGLVAPSSNGPQVLLVHPSAQPATIEPLVPIPGAPGSLRLRRSTAAPLDGAGNGGPVR